MLVIAHLKDGRRFSFREDAIIDDKEAAFVVLSYGGVQGNRTNLKGTSKNHYCFTHFDHIVYSWSDIDWIEIARESRNSTQN